MRVASRRNNPPDGQLLHEPPPPPASLKREPQVAWSGREVTGWRNGDKIGLNTPAI